jgi:hypothetical protein
MRHYAKYLFLDGKLIARFHAPNDPRNFGDDVSISALDANGKAVLEHGGKEYIGTCFIDLSSMMNEIINFTTDKLGAE